MSINMSKFRRKLVDSAGISHDHYPSIADYLSVELEVRQIIPGATDDQVQRIMDLIGSLRREVVLDPY